MKFAIPFLILGLSGAVQAALPPPSDASKPVMDAMEILSMPEANRKLVAQARSNEIYPELIQISKSSKEPMSTRWKALTLAASIGREKALPELEEALHSKEWFMRNAALISLNIHHPLKAQAAARDLLKDKALVVRSAAVDVLGYNLSSRSRDLLWEELSAKYNFRRKQGLWIRSQILSHLAKKPESQEGPLFVKALMENDKDLHSSAVAALEKLTQKKINGSSLAQKRELWIQWAKAHPQMIAR